MAMQINRVAPVFHVANLEASVAFYCEVLGFAEDFRFGTYLGLTLDQFSLHLSQSDGQGRPNGAGTVYVFCEGIDAFFDARIAGKVVDVIQPPCDAPYGMRDFIIRDLDGNQLSFGQET
ncbi:MAG: VOC family protein [Asticcacaulis sp.]|nr:VOC family protein [Asticcacaulis sp.]